MRAFIALELPDWYAAEVNECANRLAREMPGRYIPSCNYHMTLAFLGNVSQAVALGAAEVLEHAARCSVAARLEPVELGWFGRRSDATLWLGFKPTDELMVLANEVRGMLQARGLMIDERRFVPHVTLARRADLTHGEIEGVPLPGSCVVQSLTLFRSTLTPEGASYEPLSSVKLPGLPR